MERIVQDILLGKPGAVSRFYRAYAPRIRKYLILKLPSEQDSEEVLQDTFVSALDSLLLYRGEASLFTWLLSIARHEVADFYRKRYVRRVVEKTTPLFEDLLSQVETPEFAFQKKLLREQFVTAYESLSRQYQEILSLRFELGLSVKEIAIRMKLSFKATESLLYRARQAFVAAYEKNGN